MRRVKFATMAAWFVPVACLAQPVLAQEQPAENETAIDEIVVTATRQATNLQDTPIAITAVTSEALEERGITSVAELTSVVPNTQFRKAQGAFGPGVTATIRGIGSTDTSLATEPVVAFYLDDVYYPLLLGANFDLLDIDHVEVLRGPQGTLFGRNSLAGAINIVSRQPSLNDSFGSAQVTMGNYNRLDMRASLNVPLSETLGLSVSGLSKKRTGYQEILDFTCEMRRRGTPQLSGSIPYSTLLDVPSSTFAPEDCVIGHQGGEDVRAVRGSLRWQATEDVSLTLTGDYIRDTSENQADSILDIQAARVSAQGKLIANYFGVTFDQRFLTGSPYSTYATYSDPIGAGTVIPGSTFYNGLVLNGVSIRGGQHASPFTDLTNYGFSAKLSWDLAPDINFLGVVSHRRLFENQTYDDDGSPLQFVLRSQDITNSYWTAEARLSGSMDFANWVVGAFYFTANGLQHGTFISPLSGFQRLIDSQFDPTSKAVFANATFRPFGEQLGITVGGRYSDDVKVVDFNNVLDITPSASDTVFDLRITQERFDWKAGLDYAVNPDLLIYASAATGNSLPGFNARPLQPSQVAQFDGNDNIAYEIGAKMDLFDRRLRLNAAAFYTDFTNRPTTISGAEALLDANGNPVPGNRTLVPLPGGPDGSTQCGAILPGNTGITCIGRTFYRNQPAKIRGFELEYTINPVDDLLINGSVGYSKLTGQDIRDRVVNQRQNSPFWTANAGVQYTIETEQLNGSITPRVDWVYEGSQVVSGSSTVFNPLLRGHSVFSARLTYDNYDLDMQIAAGVTNLFNDLYYSNIFDSQALGSAYSQGQPAAPRQWYVSISKNF